MSVLYTLLEYILLIYYRHRVRNHRSLLFGGKIIHNEYHLMFLLGAFLSRPKVPKGTKSSYWALKFLLGPEVPFGLTLWWKWTSFIFKVKRFILTKFFLSKGLISSFNLISQKKIVLNVLSIFNNYFSKNILAGAPNRNKNAQ